MVSSCYERQARAAFELFLAPVESLNKGFLQFCCMVSEHAFKPMSTTQSRKVQLWGAAGWVSLSADLSVWFTMPQSL